MLRHLAVAALLFSGGLASRAETVQVLGRGPVDLTLCLRKRHAEHHARRNAACLLR